MSRLPRTPRTATYTSTGASTGYVSGYGAGAERDWTPEERDGWEREEQRLQARADSQVAAAQRAFAATEMEYNAQIARLRPPSSYSPWRLFARWNAQRAWDKGWDEAYPRMAQAESELLEANAAAELEYERARQDWIRAQRARS